ncbi:MAG: RagB/SusD family nutrient uptake outer membrane protein [Bacteroidales bacterium]|nr:RagB/SusD family nutrient uptake outer membrane protein [Bacteroidales bacterium]
MKKINYKIIILGVTLLSLFSCVDSLLDKKPISSFSAESFYRTQDQAKAGVFGIYNGLQSVMHTNFSTWGEGRADNVKIKHAGEPTFLHNNTLTADISSADWTSLYTLVSRANYAIANIPKVFPEGDPTGNQLIGQARALRALAYFYLVRVWGDVPLILEPYTQTGQDLFVSRDNSELVLNQIEEDLKFAAANCVDKFNNTNDRIMFNKGSANGLLTQVYMWRKKYSDAIATADLVLANPLYTLVPNIAAWGKMFSDSYSTESIFEVGYNDTQTNGLRVLYAIGSDARYSPSTRFMATFEPGDLRQSYIYDVTQAEPKAVWKYLGKGVSDQISTPSKQNIILIRLADIMMLKAEALNKAGGSANISNALKLLEPIRMRAGLTPALLTESQAIAMYGSVENAILHERSVELSFEGHRWFDLVRTGKAISTMQPINGLSDTRNLVWPIHISTINKNPNIVQNEFYR